MRAIWSGSIAFGLVNIPIKLYSATQDSALDLDMLERKTGNHIKFKRVDEATGKEVPWDQIVKAFNYNDKYVVLEDEDFEAASPKKSKVIEIESFVDAAEIDAMYYETPYFVEPVEGGEKAYALLQQALGKAGKVGLARFVMRSAEHLAAVRAKDNYLVVQQLRFEQELRQPKELDLPKPVKFTARELAVALELIDQYSGPFNIEAYEDEYRAELMKIIKNKAGGKKIVPKKLEIVHTKSDDLFEQLRASLGQGSKKRAS
jgi:DNA end-binding protein Ku